MKLAFLYVAIILFVLDFLLSLWPTRPAWSSGLISLGLAFYVASYVVPAT